MVFLMPDTHIMNEVHRQNEQAFLNVGGAVGVEPHATINTQKEQYLVSEFLKHLVSWLETESLYYSYAMRGEAQEVWVTIKDN
jgi:hypothetical protein